MIISHKYKYIFLKTTKTAGTSIEIYLSKCCGLDDIITPISSKDEMLRQPLGISPRNYQDYTRSLELTEYRFKDIQTLLMTGKKPTITTTFWNHMPASKVKRAIGSKIWNSYFKFCFVRNPWDRAISRYYWNIEKMGSNETLENSLKQNNPNSNFEIYTMKNKLAVDFVGKYENLLEDLDFVCRKLNISPEDGLPIAKKGAKKDKRHYSEILNEEQANYIQTKCKEEIEWFGYEF